ncbi:STAS domain-containing protein [Tundrisphaera lichenicola]|uniref:STAS domain-containing protein n=1 Tax=Tundrisphaera lichenicola TaxID=2029860 RepID=UPI003EBB01A9
MAINVRFEGEIAILSNFARLMNDPRHFDAVRDLRELLDQGYRRFVLDVGGVRETGSTVLGLLTTLTRQVRNSGGEVALANVSPPLEKYLEEMRMDAYWDVFDDSEGASEFLDRSKPGGPDPG